MATRYGAFVDLSKLRKVESPNPRQAAKSVTGLVTAIIKVRTPNYRPEGVTVRSSVSPTMFTAEFQADALATREGDPEVETISFARPLQSSAN